MNRRQFLGYTAIATGMAGCLGGDDDDTGEPAEEVPVLTDPPAYAKWLEPDTQPNTFIHTDFDRVRQSDTYRPLLSLFDGESDADLSEIYPEISGIAEAVPAQSGIFAMLFFEFARYRYPFLDYTSIVGIDGRGGRQTPVLDVETYSAVDGVTILGGDVDLEELTVHESVTEIDSRDTYRIFETSPSTVVADESYPLAANESTVVFPTHRTGEQSTDETAGGPRDRLDSALQTAMAGVPFEEGELAWLIEQCDVGAFALGTFGTTDSYRPDESSNGSIDVGIDPSRIDDFNSLVADSTGLFMVADRASSGRTTRTGITYGNAPQLPEAEEFEFALAAGARSSTVTVDDAKMFVSAEWD